jgi:outer membrane protein OmpA-like peptidoglycan-associated protein
MNPHSAPSVLFARPLAIILLASAFGVSAYAQTPGDTAAQSQPSPHVASPTQPSGEGFWGRVNPFARKKWVKRQLDPIHDQLSELDEVNAKNGRDIRDVDSRAQAGIGRAQSTADAAGQTAAAAGDRARQAGLTAQNANSRVDRLNTTVSNLDTYNQIDQVDVAFHGGQPILSAEARKQLDALADRLNGQPGYILEMEAHSPAAGGAGIQNSERLAEAVKRYLVTQHEIPVYRMHAVALGNVPGSGDEAQARPVRSSSVHVRLMENSLAAQEAASPQSASSLTGAERP